MPDNTLVIQAIVSWAPFYLPDVHRVGGYVNRNVRGTNKPSAHASGLAADIYVATNKQNSRDPDLYKPIQKNIGDQLFIMFSWYGLRWGVDHVIWNTRIWDDVAASGRIEAYTGSGGPHLNHVHVAFKSSVANALPTDIALKLNNIREQLYGDRIHGPPPLPETRRNHFVRSR